MKHLISLALLGAGAYVLSSAPSFRVHPLEKNFSHRCFAHRGLFNNDDCCENSLSAFEAAASAGYGIELDLQITRDGKIVVFHDSSLSRMCGVNLKVEQTDYQTLQQHYLGKTEETIPLFSEVLQLVNGRVPLIVEIKTTEQIERVCLSAYDLLRKYNGDYCIESMNPLIVHWFSKNAPQIMRGQLATRLEEKGAAAIPASVLSGMKFNFFAKPHFIAYDHRYAANSSAFRFCKSCGALTVGWTIREQDFEAAKKMFDVIIFEGFFPPVTF